VRTETVGKLLLGHSRELGIEQAMDLLRILRKTGGLTDEELRKLQRPTGVPLLPFVRITF
jgi:hypothetical protein